MLQQTGDKKSTMRSDGQENNINIKEFILPKYTPAKPLETNIEVVFENEILVHDPEEHVQKRCMDMTYPFARSEPQSVPILRSLTLLNGSEGQASKSVTEITLGIGKIWSDHDWLPGDTIGIIPSNAEEDVADLLELLDLSEKCETKCRVSVTLRSTKKTVKVPVHIPSPTTPKEILRDCLSLKSILKKQFISSLAACCSDRVEKDFLNCLSSKEGSHFYNDLVIKNGLTLIEVLKLCPTCKPSLNLIVEHLGRLQPRPYSIANSPLRNSKEIQIIYSTLSQRPGVTTSMLKDLTKRKNPMLVVYLRQPNMFRFSEEDVAKNQVLIAIGTGLAPFLGFLQHKEYVISKERDKLLGRTWLFVGAKTRQAVIHRDTLIKLVSNNILNKFEEALSQEINSTNSQYVQDSLESCSKEFATFLMLPQTTVFLCADGGQISKCIEKSIRQILQKELKVSEDESLQMMKEFKTTGKFKEDLWV